MEDLSLHILDIAQNSFRANSNLLELEIIEDEKNNRMSISFKDDGDGMDEAMLEKVLDPFFTTRTTRDVGMGLSLFKMACEQSGGTLAIDSTLGQGTKVIATLEMDHINRLPIGDLAMTVYLLMINDYGSEVAYRHLINGKAFELSSIEIKEVLGDVSLKELDVMRWMKDTINTSLKELRY